MENTSKLVYLVGAIIFVSSDSILRSISFTNLLYCLPSYYDNLPSSAVFDCIRNFKLKIHSLILEKLFFYFFFIVINEAIYLSELHINKSQVGSEKNNTNAQKPAPSNINIGPGQEPTSAHPNPKIIHQPNIVSILFYLDFNC
jgi:hypothetical protein